MRAFALDDTKIAGKLIQTPMVKSAINGGISEEKSTVDGPRKPLGKRRLYGGKSP
jgi:hypothetical protein